MRERLEQTGTDDAIAEETVTVLLEQGVVNDARFARLFVEDKRGLEQWGSDRIRRGLVSRGVPREVIEQALKDDDPQDELERALALLRTRFPEPPQERRERDRALGMMVRKGYDIELGVDALESYARDSTRT